MAWAGPLSSTSLLGYSIPVSTCGHGLGHAHCTLAACCICRRHHGDVKQRWVSSLGRACVYVCGRLHWCHLTKQNRSCRVLGLELGVFNDQVRWVDQCSEKVQTQLTRRAVISKKNPDPRQKARTNQHAVTERPINSKQNAKNSIDGQEIHVLQCPTFESELDICMKKRYFNTLGGCGD